MKTSEYELPTDRLASTDEQGHRVFIHPADVSGKYHRYRKLVHGFLIVMFLILPWIKINGYQSILLDIAHRKFTIFGLAFWAHDAPMLIFVFGSVFVGILLTTAVWGRLWCGWGCPETVFVESVYRWIERKIEGNSVQRKRLDAQPWDFKKVRIRGLKWLAFLAVTLVITHSFLAYFVGTEELATWIRRSPMEHPTAFGVMVFTTAILLGAFGWFREQFCIILCPYGRFQSTLMDENSLVVAYDEKRGEPRREKGLPKDQQGDCINCYRCVQVCPTGIDIRRGVQMECVACTACVDACDEVMLRVKQPTGLIRYTTLASLAGGKPQHFRARVIILSVILIGILSGLSYVLLTRPEVKATIFNAKSGAPYMVLDQSEDPQITNQFMMNISNYALEDAKIWLEITDESFKNKVEIKAQQQAVTLAGGEETKSGFFLKFPKSMLNQNGSARIHVMIHSKALDDRWERSYTQEVPLVGPF